MRVMKSKVIFGQLSRHIGNDTVEAWVTDTGGQVGPIKFRLEGGEIEPMSVAPWAEEGLDLPPILNVLRGDFFCMPFGGNEEPFGGEQHPIHGETANERWHLESHTNSSLKMSLEAKVRRARVTKQVWVQPGQAAVYQRHTISGASGPMCLGHHAMVKFRTKGLISTSPFGFGQVFPGQFENPVMGGYSSLKPGARFEDLQKVPTANGDLADLTQYPAREGFEDLVMIYSQKESEFGWTAVHFPEEGFTWFSLKDQRVLSGTVMWHSNGGRHYAPWSGRHRAVLGLEEVTSSFHWGLAGSAAPSDASREGYLTTHELRPDVPLTVNTIIGVVRTGPLAPSPVNILRIPSGIRIIDANDQSIDVQLDVEQLYSS